MLDNNAEVAAYVDRFQADIGALLPGEVHPLPDLRSQIVKNGKHVQCSTGYNEGLLLDAESK